MPNNIVEYAFVLCKRQLNVDHNYIMLTEWMLKITDIHIAAR